jgi:hypothetical protein
MNTTQLSAMRNLWNEVNSQPETMTAREMALTPHNLNRDASIARTTDGRKFVWIEKQERWVVFK